MQTKSSASDFDFWMGSWKIHNRRLRERLKGSTRWDEFESTADARSLLGGLGNEDVFRTDFEGGFTGMSFRFFDKATGLWSIYWTDSRRPGKLDPPVVGRFEGEVGVFEGSDTLEGRPIRIRFIWSRVTTPTPRWEQAFSEDGGKTWETNWVMEMTRNDAMGSREYPVVELRRYEIKPGERERFARHFDAHVPEAFEQIGFIGFGQFQERRNPNGFAWLRGFPSYDARPDMNTDFYRGLVWKEVGPRLNARILDINNVLLLRPLAPGRGLAVLSALDAVTEEGEAPGIVVLQIFALKAGATEEATRRADEGFAAYRSAGARERGVLVTLDAPNNYPRLPVRTDGPHLVWVGVVRDEAMLQTRLQPLIERTARALQQHGLLREAPELVLLDPTRRSRLRWRTEWS